MCCNYKIKEGKRWCEKLQRFGILKNDLVRYDNNKKTRSSSTKAAKAWKEYMQKILLNYKNLEVIADPVVKFLFEGDKVIGFICQSGKEVRTKELILTTGTFLNGLIHIGETQIPAGRYDEKPSTGLSEQLAKFKMQIGRLKTGTPPRLDGSTINYDDLELQPNIHQSELSYL